MAKKRTKLTFEKRRREQKKKLKRIEKLERKHNKGSEDTESEGGSDESPGPELEERDPFAPL